MKPTAKSPKFGFPSTLMFVSTTILQKPYSSYLNKDRRWWRSDTRGEVTLFSIQTAWMCVRVIRGRCFWVSTRKCMCVRGGWGHQTKLPSHLRVHCVCNHHHSIHVVWGQQWGSGLGTLLLVLPFHRISAGVNTDTLLLLTHTHTETGLRSYKNGTCHRGVCAACII